MKKAFLTAATLMFALFVVLPADAQDGPLVFEVEALNAGLGPVPDVVERATPRETFETLFEAARTEDWDSAAHLLNLNDLPLQVQADQGAEIAFMLKTLIDRKIVLDWSQLSDRPDAINEAATDRAAMAGEPRRSLRIWEFQTDGPPASLRLNRLQAPGQDPVWVFSANSVAHVPALYEAYGPSRFEAFLPEMLKRDIGWGIMWWELIGIPIVLVIATLVGLATHRLIRRSRRVFDSGVARAVIGAAATPLVIAAVTAVIWWGTSNVFVFSGRLNVILSPLIAIGFVSSLLLLITHTIEEVLDRLVGFDDIDLTSHQKVAQREKATKIAAIRRLLLVAIFIIGCGIVLSTADVFRSLGFSILASAGALTLVLGFAARKVLGNIMASMQISLNQSARVGDRVVYKDNLAHVERINLTYVQLRLWDGTRLVVPVEEFANETFTNWTLHETSMLRILKFRLHPSADIDKLREIFDDVLDTLDPADLDDREKASVKVADQDVFGIGVWFAVPCSDPNTSWDVSCAAREELVKRMRELESDDTRIFPEAAAAEAA